MLTPLINFFQVLSTRYGLISLDRCIDLTFIKILSKFWFLFGFLPWIHQLIVASFKQNISLEIRRKYPAGTSIAANIYGNSQMVEVSIEDRSLMDDPPPATVTVRADPPKADCIISSDNNTIGLNNLQKADPVKAENNELNNLRDTGLYQK